MSLVSGTKLGSYEIQSPLGAGGMGEVYRARDTKLDRNVALKVLPETVAGDPVALARFESEAKALAALSNPHILAIHDFGRIGEVSYAVSELLEGGTLRATLVERPLPVRRALEIGEKIALGLAAAHEKGIVHRDLKPENVFLTADGNVKILDFGLARREAATSGPEDTKSPTLVKLTEPGVVFGTVAYMSPEQARGAAVDFRSDQFSLGVVLFEMLAGKRPFDRPTPAETMAAIIREEPAPLGTVAPSTPSPVKWIIERCLSKEPSERYASTRDLARDLATCRQHLSETISASVAAPPARRAWRSRAALAIGIAAAIALAFSLGVLFATRFRQPNAPSAHPVSLALSLPVDAALITFNQNPLALTPDGKTLVYVGSKGGEARLFVRPLDREEIREIPGTEDASSPFVSPDGQWVGFFAEKKLKKVALAGGSPIALCSAPDHRGGSWGADGTIVFAPTPRAALQRIPASGGESKEVTKPDVDKVVGHVFPQVLPDGENVLFSIIYGGGRFRSAVVSLRTGEQRTILEDAGYPRYLPTGHLVFTRRGLLYATPFSLQRLETAGPPEPLLDDLLTNRYGRSPEFAFSQEGTLVYVPFRQLHRTLVWVDRKGAIERLPFPPGDYREVALSPDGNRLVAISVGKAEAQSLLIGDLARGTLTRSAADGAFVDMVWTPDGRRIAFAFAPEEARTPYGVFWQSADGSSPPERLGRENVLQAEYPSSFSPDRTELLGAAQKLLYTGGSDKRWETFVLPLTGEREPHPLFQTKFDVWFPRFSPDGRWVGYQSLEAGRWEVFVSPFPGPGAKLQISIEGGDEQRWSRSGHELFYRQGDRMMAVDVETKPTFRAGRPRALFEGNYFSPGFGSYDVSPDGTRFLMIKPDPEESGPAHVKVVLNWFEEVRRRVAGAR